MIVEYTSSEFVSINPILKYEEVGHEIDTNKVKYGDGTTAWNDLDYCGILLVRNHIEVDPSYSTTNTTYANILMLGGM